MPRCPLTSSSSLPATGPAALRIVAISGILALLAGCTAPPPAPAEAPNDPLEPVNRVTHRFNKGADTYALRPASQVYGRAVPQYARDRVENFADNLFLPTTILNNVLQGDVESAGRNSFRFLVNTTFGLLGVLDPASDMGLAEDDSDFGETLHVWGSGEGPYVEIPLLGPATSRDAVGKVVDFATNPLGNAFNSSKRLVTYSAEGLSLVGDRYSYTQQVDSILYESADSYSQERLLYLQNRRFELGSQSEADVYDPYEDPYAE